MLLNLSSFVVISVQFDESEEKNTLAPQIRSTCIYVFHHSFGYRVFAADSQQPKHAVFLGSPCVHALEERCRQLWVCPLQTLFTLLELKGFPVSSFCGWITKSRRDNRTC